MARDKKPSRLTFRDVYRAVRGYRSVVFQIKLPQEPFDMVSLGTFSASTQVKDVLAEGEKSLSQKAGIARETVKYDSHVSSQIKGISREIDENSRLVQKDLILRFVVSENESPVSTASVLTMQAEIDRLQAEVGSLTNKCKQQADAEEILISGEFAYLVDWLADAAMFGESAASSRHRNFKETVLYTVGTPSQTSELEVVLRQLKKGTTFKEEDIIRILDSIRIKRKPKAHPAPYRLKKHNRDSLRAMFQKHWGTDCQDILLLLDNVIKGFSSQETPLLLR